MSRWIDADAYERELRTSNIIHHYGEQIVDKIHSAPSIDIVRCGECKYCDTGIDEDGNKFWKCLGIHYGGVNPDDFCSYGSRSEKPNSCEHITEDGVTCAKYPACDDCLDNPLNKVKGSERLVKGSEQTDLVEDSPSLVKDLVKAFGEDGTWLERQGVYTLTLAEAKQRAVDIIESVLAKDEPTISKMEQVEDEPQTDWKDEMWTEAVKDEPQTERSE